LLAFGAADCTIDGTIGGAVLNRCFMVDLKSFLDAMSL